jgi:hypothetical protein
MGADFDLSNEDGIRTAIITYWDSQMVAIERACPKKHTSEKNYPLAFLSDARSHKEVSILLRPHR